jgi:hypothetical protein
MYTGGFSSEEEESFTAKSALCRDGSSGKCGSGEGWGGVGGGGGVYAVVFVHICPLDFVFQVQLFRKFVKGVACVLHMCVACVLLVCCLCLATHACKFQVKLFRKFVKRVLKRVPNNT